MQVGRPGGAGPIRRHRIAIAVLACVVAVSVSVALFVTYDRRPSSGPGATSGTGPSGSSGPSTPAPSSTRTGQAPPTPVEPPKGTVHLSDGYLRTYGASRVRWADVLARGKPLPAPSRGCADRWRRSGKDPRLDWASVEFLCLDVLEGKGFKPQGVAGSSTTRGYSIGNQPAAKRNILLVSSYSRRQVPGLFARNHAGESVTRLLVIDRDRRRYATVELVKPDGPARLRNLNSHGSGVAWAGQYLYSSSASKLWMYNADDLMEISGRLVLPAVAHWETQGRGGLSSISLDTSARPYRLKGINYTRTGQAYVHTFTLAANGLLQTRSRGRGQALSLRSRFGDPRRVIHSARSQQISGTHYQGVGTRGPYLFANSSGLRTPASGAERVDATAVFKNGRRIGVVQMPQSNGESIFLDYQRERYVSMVENGGQFLFSIPIRQLVRTARR